MISGQLMKIDFGRVNKMSEYTEERCKSAEDAIELLASPDIRQEEKDRIYKSHITKYTPADPDKELRERFTEYFKFLQFSRNIYKLDGCFDKAIELNLLATQKHDNEVRVKVLDFLVNYRMSQDLTLADAVKELRTRYQTEGQ